jgi:hypothetical protein
MDDEEFRKALVLIYVKGDAEHQKLVTDACLVAVENGRASTDDVLNFIASIAKSTQQMSSAPVLAFVNVLRMCGYTKAIGLSKADKGGIKPMPK